MPRAERPDPALPATPAAIAPTDAAQAVRLAHYASRSQWHREGYRLDLAEYQDAALDALTACLASYDPTRGVPLADYARQRIWGAVQRAWVHYRTWHTLRQGRWWSAPPCAEVLRPRGQDFTQRVHLAQQVQTLPVDAQQYAELVLQGATDREYAQATGLTTPRWVKARVQRWRRAGQATGALLWILWFQVSASPPLPVPRLFPSYHTCMAYTQTMDHRTVGAPGQTVRYWCAAETTEA